MCVCVRVVMQVDSASPTASPSSSSPSAALPPTASPTAGGLGGVLSSVLNSTVSSTQTSAAVDVDAAYLNTIKASIVSMQTQVAAVQAQVRPILECC